MDVAMYLVLLGLLAVRSVANRYSRVAMNSDQLLYKYQYLLLLKRYGNPKVKLNNNI